MSYFYIIMVHSAYSMWMFTSQLSLLKSFLMICFVLFSVLGDADILPCHAGVNVIKLFCSSPTLWKVKLKCLSLARFVNTD
jgi:hypothetical protein